MNPNMPAHSECITTRPWPDFRTRRGKFQANGIFAMRRDVSTFKHGGEPLKDKGEERN